MEVDKMVELTTVVKHGTKIQHKEAHTVAQIVGTAYGCYIVLTPDGLLRKLMFKDVKCWEIVS